jgi:excisionase family DNA binding protein
MNVPHPYLTIREIVALLALSKRTILRYITEGKLKAYRVAGEKSIGSRSHIVIMTGWCRLSKG